ncbi:HIT family protein [Herbaspirillum sp. ST 5-3]|uniref:HIT family protein n=1 Tax=Oxalobacteraceae TaxID=75682 RepID=UPI0020003A1E|nr:HIT family protein [Herbaspirillum sp. ST 5-3]
MESTTPPCPFCAISDAVFLLNQHVHARWDLHPVTPAHALLVPNRHVASFFDTTDDERAALLQLLKEAKALLDDRHAPAGYNIGINIGEAAGQTIPHAHVHLIPRYHGDVENPRGGVRGVIPARQSY